MSLLSRLVVGGLILTAGWAGSSVDVKIGEPLQINPPSNVLSQRDEENVAKAIATGNYMVEPKIIRNPQVSNGMATDRLFGYAMRSRPIIVVKDSATGEVYRVGLELQNNKRSTGYGPHGELLDLVPYQGEDGNLVYVSLRPHLGPI